MPPGEVDFEQVALHNQAAQHNVDVMNGYTSASQFNADGQPASYGQLADDLTGGRYRYPARRR